MILALSILAFARTLSAGAEVITPRKNIQLFNGTNFAGLYTYLKDSKREDARGVFSCTNGMIRITGEGLGYLATENEYRNYELIVEFKWGEGIANWRKGKARDSGIFLHATGPDGNSHDDGGAFMAAIECNVFQGANGDILLIRGTDSSGKLIAPRLTAFVSDQRDDEGWRWCRTWGRTETIERWGRLNWIKKSAEWKDELDYRGPHDVERPYGEWNSIKCVCDGDVIRIELNGELVNTVRAVWPNQGKILLQSEGSEIFFRKVELRPLSRTSKSE